MAIVTSDLLFLTLAGLKTEFDAAYNKANENPEWRLIADEIPTTLPAQVHGWMGRGAVMKQFIAEPEHQSASGYTQTVSDILYKADLVIQRKMLEDDQYGILARRARGMAGEAVRHWNQLVYQGLVNGFTSTCYDGKNFFANNHSEGASGTQNNTDTQTLSDVGLETADTTMRGYKDDKGIPMEVIPDTLVVGPLLQWRAQRLVGSEVVVHLPGDGTAGSGATTYTPFSNVFRGRYNLVVNPYITGYQWFLLDTKRDVKPILMQSRSDVPITLETDMDQPSAKILEQYQFTLRGRYTQFYGLWQFAYGSNASS